MTSEPTAPDDLPEGERLDATTAKDGGDDRTGDDLDRTFADVEQELGQTLPSNAVRPGDVHADADDFANMNIDDADDVFVIDDDDFGAQALSTAPVPEEAATSVTTAAPAGDLHVRGAGAEAAEAVAPTPASLEDDLFAPPEAGEASERFGEGNHAFAEGRSPSNWAGSQLSPEDIGIDARAGDDHTRETTLDDEGGWASGTEDDIEIVADDDFGDDLTGDLGTEAGTQDGVGTGPSEVGEFAVVDADPSEQFGIQPVDEEELSAPASGVWAGTESETRRAPRAWQSHTSAGEPAISESAETELGEVHDGTPLPEEGDEDSYDPIYGAEAAATEAEEAMAAVEGSEPDYSEYEASYVDQTADRAPVVGAPALRPRRRVSYALAAAAALVICGVTAGFAFMRPEWLGLQKEPALIDRAIIARPTLGLTLTAPPAPSDAGPAEVPVPVVPEPVAVTKPPEDPAPLPTDPSDGKPLPVETPVVRTDEPKPSTSPGGEEVVPPTPKPEPTETEPAPTSAPVAKEDPPVSPTPLPGTEAPPDQAPNTNAPTNQPVLTGDPATTTTPVAVAVEPVAPATTASQADVLRVGEDLQIGVAPPAHSRPRVHHLAEGLVTGSQAFAQLRNMNFFLGRVKAMDSSFLTLDLAPGEITIAFDDLNAIVPLASDEYRMMQGSAEGFVRLTNRNKLFGKILTNSLADNVVLEVQQSHVVIPRASIEEVGQQTRSAVQVVEEEDSDWIRAILQRQTPKAAPKGASPAPPSGAPPAPPTDR